MKPDQWQHMLANPNFLAREKIVEAPEVKETHVSYVILTTNWAYKIKKTKKLPFLDFSSLEKRRLYCHSELRLNQRLAPAMYLSVLPIQLNQNSIFVGEGNGEIIDYAIKMKRMDNNLEMDRMLASGTVTKENITALAHHIADFHSRAEVVQVKYTISNFRGWFNPIEDLVSFINQFLGSHYSVLVRRAILVSNQFIQSHIQVLNERSKTGLVRDLHGDLHSKNIFLTQPPTVFDCIEFDSKLRQIDLLSEIAFLCMDLEYWGHGRYATLFYKSYISQLKTRGLDHVGDELLLIYFKMYRANIRAKVLALQALQDAEPELLWAQAKQYLNLMDRYCGYFSAN